MVKFDTNVQQLKYCALKEVAKATYEKTEPDIFYAIPKKILPGPEATMRCCIYKERAIFSERLKLAMGGDRDVKDIIQVIDIACDECPASGYTVSDMCRGCIAHRCVEACPKDAITFDEHQKAFIDKSKCINCGKCATACQYSAIINRTRPCENACKVKAISMGPSGAAHIDRDKCISCGACVYQCPFGAVTDKSFITDVIHMMMDSDNNTKYKVYAIVAPSIASQYKDVKLEQAITGLKKLGFYTVIETAWGADMVAAKETEELVQKGMLFSSCCPSFVEYIKLKFPSLIDKISSNLSPMVELGKYIKKNDVNSKVVFIGPCTSKKKEAYDEKNHKYIDSVLTFEEMQAMFDSKNIDLKTLPETVLDNASYFGRIFARSGGLTDALREGLKEANHEDFDFNPVVCSGVNECNKALLLAKIGKLQNNFIEGMACDGGCIGGPCALTHGSKDANEVNKYGSKALEKTIKSSLDIVSKV